MRFTPEGRTLLSGDVRRQFHIGEHANAIAQATPEVVALRPVTAVAIRRLKGFLKHRTGDRPFAEERAERKADEVAMTRRPRA
jgi:hypothetical protein